MAKRLINNAKLKEELLKQGVGVAKMSEITGLSRSLCSLVLSGKRPVTTNTLDVILKEFPAITLENILNNEYK